MLRENGYLNEEIEAALALFGDVWVAVAAHPAENQRAQHSHQR